MCKNVKLTIQNFTFLASFYVLPIQGADVVVEVQWLRELGPITIDYKQLCMSFSQEGQNVFLTGDKAQLTQVTHHQLRCLLKVDAIASLFYLRAQITTVPSESITSNTTLESVLSKFSQLFESPSSLPPSRLIEHHIHLKQGTSPINVRPYRYPHFQKGEIEK